MIRLLQNSYGSPKLDIKISCFTDDISNRQGCPPTGPRELKHIFLFAKGGAWIPRSPRKKKRGRVIVHASDVKLV